MALQQLTCNKCTKHLGMEERTEERREKRREERREKGSTGTALLLGNVNF